MMFGSCQASFTNVLGMKCAAAKIVPKLLNFEKKQSRTDIAHEMSTTFNDNPDLLEKVIVIIAKEASRRDKASKSRSTFKHETCGSEDCSKLVKF